MQEIIKKAVYLVIFFTIIQPKCTYARIFNKRLDYGLFESSQQSSSYFVNENEVYLCFNKTDKEIDGFFYFHSNNVTDSGYHWLVVKLRRLIAISAVTIQSRELSSKEIFNRSVGIEVWLQSQPSDFQLDRQHSCNSSRTALEFKRTKASWAFCGTSLGDSAGQKLTVNCPKAQVTSMLLLRKPVSQLPGENYMAFSNLWLGEDVNYFGSSGEGPDRLRLGPMLLAGAIPLAAILIAAATLAILYARMQKQVLKARAATEQQQQAEQRSEDYQGLGSRISAMFYSQAVHLFSASGPQVEEETGIYDQVLILGEQSKHAAGNEESKPLHSSG